MKCKNCGANYKTRELICPYCNTENILGKIWQSERSQAEIDYESEKKKVGKSLSSPYMVNRILSRILVIIVLLYVVSIVGIFLFLVLEEQFCKLHFMLNKDKIETQMEAYHDAGEYELLYLYMNEEYVDFTQYYTYAQAALLNEEYNRYLEYRFKFQELPEDEKLEDDFYLEFALSYSKDVYNLNCGIYSEPSEQNRELYEQYQKEIMAYWVGTLKLTQEEIQYLTSEESYYYNEFDAIIQGIKERRCW